MVRVDDKLKELFEEKEKYKEDSKEYKKIEKDIGDRIHAIYNS